MKAEPRFRKGSRKDPVYQSYVQGGAGAAKEEGRRRGLSEGTLQTWISSWTSTTLTSKGQVTIPKRFRDHLDLKPGSAVEFGLGSEGEVVIRKAGGRGPAKPSRFARLRGSATAGMTTDEIMALTRGDDWKGSS